MRKRTSAAAKSFSMGAVSTSGRLLLSGVPLSSHSDPPDIGALSLPPFTMAGGDQSPTPQRDRPTGGALRQMLSSMVSVAERLAVLAQAKRVDELTELATLIDAETGPLEGELRDEVWANTSKVDRFLSRISRCMDQGDIQGAAQSMIKLSTHAVHRHAKSREQFFTVGRGSGAQETNTAAERTALQVQTALDSVIPEVKQYFHDLAEADADQQVSASVASITDD